ncbi:hypothetical protein [Ruminiclostridium sufflavum]|uniref:hypothetical protein n=1 Tax=Ruminiclostridium sufflavum TaxID=396504 RepID=UPI001403FD86|nr:hypothetical protein [Ruminiclostridium sufflavum]
MRRCSSFEYIIGVLVGLLLGDIDIDFVPVVQAGGVVKRSVGGAKKSVNIK